MELARQGHRVVATMPCRQIFAQLITATTAGRTTPVSDPAAVPLTWMVPSICCRNGRRGPTLRCRGTPLPLRSPATYFRRVATFDPSASLGRGERLSHRRRTAGTPDPSDEIVVSHIVTIHEDAHVALEQARLVDCRTAPRLLDAPVDAADEPTLLWIGCSGCSGETQALLGVEGQALDLVDLIDVDGLRLLWHPSLAEQDLGPVYDDVMAGRERLTVLCVEGSIALAEDGMFDIAGDVGKFEIVRSLCERADYVMAMGACAAYGGWQAQPPNPSGAVGLQYTLDSRRRAAAPGVALPGRAAGHHAGRMPRAGRHAGRRAALGVEWRSWWPWPVRHGADGPALPAQHRVPGLRDTAADRDALHGLHRPEVPQLRVRPSHGAVGGVSERVEP